MSELQLKYCVAAVVNCDMGVPETIITVRDLIARGLIRPPVELRGKEGQDKFLAVLHADGTVLVGDDKFSSLSVAAGTLITKKTGKKSPGRQYSSRNGWTFWYVADQDGNLQSLADVRQKAIESDN